MALSAGVRASGSRASERHVPYNCHLYKKLSTNSIVLNLKTHFEVIYDFIERWVDHGGLRFLFTIIPHKVMFSKQDVGWTYCSLLLTVKYCDHFFPMGRWTKECYIFVKRDKIWVTDFKVKSSSNRIVFYFFLRISNVWNSLVFVFVHCCLLLFDLHSSLPFIFLFTEQ